MGQSEMSIDVKLACIVSANVALRKEPIRMAERSDPVDEADSGWQFWSGQMDPLESKGAQIWSIEEVLELEPSLVNHLDLPTNTRLEHDIHTGRWELR
jgi:hypothetical protein